MGAEYSIATVTRADGLARESRTTFAGRTPTTGSTEPEDHLPLVRELGAQPSRLRTVRSTLAPVRVSRSSIHIEAPRETVWSVVTEPAYVKQWQYGSDLQTDWSVGSQIRFVSEWEGQTFEQWGTVVHVDAPNRLAYSLFAPRPDLEDKPENLFHDDLHPR